MNPPSSLQDFLRRIEEAGELRRVTAEVDPELEITEIATRAVRERGPALLFERVRGSPYPLCLNIFASSKRIEIALGRSPEAIGAAFVDAFEKLRQPSPRGLWRARDAVWRATKMRLRRVRRAPSQEVIEEPDLDRLPILKCWPHDGGRFLTFPLILTTGRSPQDRNLGLYRMHVYSATETGLHWQIQKGGGFHHYEAERRREPLEVAVAIGGDPILMMAGMWPLPEGVDELLFSGFIRGRPTRVTQATSIGLEVPADAEWILEGVVLPGERRPEGPFGDHYGHYSGVADFPVFHVRKVTRRRAPVYVASVVGKPPQEDMYLGNAVQEMFNPIVRILRPEVRDLWSYYEGGFHTLLGISMESRYKKEGIKTALGLLGEGTLSLSKVVLVTGPATNVRNFSDVLDAVRENFKPSRDFLLLPGTAMDTLDFTGHGLNLGSKMIIDATGDLGPCLPSPPPPDRTCELREFGYPVGDQVVLQRTMVVVRILRESRPQARDVLESLVGRDDLGFAKIIALVDEDVDLRDPVSIIWGVFTRFDPARDVVFRSATMRGACPIHDGPLGIDATLKPGYPAPLEMDSAIVERVDRRWEELFPAGL